VFWLSLQLWAVHWYFWNFPAQVRGHRAWNFLSDPSRNVEWTPSRPRLSTYGCHRGYAKGRRGELVWRAFLAGLTSLIQRLVFGLACCARRGLRSAGHEGSRFSRVFGSCWAVAEVCQLYKFHLVSCVFEIWIWSSVGIIGAHRTARGISLGSLAPCELGWRCVLRYVQPKYFIVKEREIYL